MKIVLKAILSIALIVSVLVVPKGLYNVLNTDKITDEMYKRRERYFYGVINLWQIDSFEGGTGSRANWLKSICAGFERKNNGVFINVESVTLETAEKLIKSGQKRPDMISYGAGCELSFEYFEKLAVKKLPDTKDALCDIAVPWCMGAYFMIGDGETDLWGNDGALINTKKGSKTIYSVGVPERKGHNAYYGLLKNCPNSFNSEYSLVSGTSQEMFELYNYSQRVNRIIGTQRDLYRLKTLEERELARIGNVEYLGFTDLFQYVSIFKCDDEKKKDTMNDFIDYILDEAQQNKLGTIGMFPVVFSSQPEYDNNFVKNGWQEIKKAEEVKIDSIKKLQKVD